MRRETGPHLSDRTARPSGSQLFSCSVGAGFVSTNQQERVFATLSDCSGATQSHLVIIDDRGKKYGKWSRKGLNYHLEGRENGMGLSGAEDESVNEHIVGILRHQHGDVANEFFLTSDSVITIAATFNKDREGGSVTRKSFVEGSMHADNRIIQVASVNNAV
uniref:Uncharacterized protein n=1 Tax=Parascaris equorum TaxID=6256 RepID=A0A914RUK6_PAREQ